MSNSLGDPRDNATPGHFGGHEISPSLLISFPEI